MSLLKKSGLFILFILLTVSAFGQQNDIKYNLLSFKTWLSNSWVKSQLSYDTCEITNEKIKVHLILNCERGCDKTWDFLTHTADSISGVKFEDYLLEKASFLLEFSKKDIALEIVNRPPEYEYPCFSKKISFKDSLIVFTINCKDVESQSQLSYANFRPFFSMARVRSEHQDQKAEQILAYIFDKCRTYFKLKGKSVDVEKLDATRFTLNFKVMNLSNLIVPASAFHSKTVEVLTFSIFCSTRDDFAEFRIRLNGKFRGVYATPEYFDLELNYKEELSDYVKFFANNTLVSWLRSTK